MSNDAERQPDKLDDAIGQYARAVDAVHYATIALARCMEMTPEEVPRLLAAAACRSVEVLLEAYERRAADIAGGRADEWAPQEKKLRRQQISQAATDLVSTLTDALKQAKVIETESRIGPKLTVQ